MNFITKTILNSRHNHANALILRLCKKSNRMQYTNTAWNKIFITVTSYSTHQETKLKKPAYNRRTNPNQEIDCFYAVIQNSTCYSGAIIEPLKVKGYCSPHQLEMLHHTDWSSETAANSLNALKKLTFYYLDNSSHIEDTLNDKILRACADKVSAYNNIEFHTLMKYLITLYKTVESLDIRYIVPILSKECLKRYYSRTNSINCYNDMLSMINAFYQLNQLKVDYVWRTLRKLIGKPDRLSEKQLVLLLFYLGLCSVPNLNMYNIQWHIHECLPQLTTDDLGIIARGFFMNQKLVSHNKLMEEIMQKVSNNMDTISSISLGAIIKLIRYSTNSHANDKFCELLTKLHQKVDKLTLLSLTHIVHAIGARRVYDKFLLDFISNKFMDNIETVRIKDIERLVYTICTVSPYEEYQQTCRTILNYLLAVYKTTREKEIKAYPASFSRVCKFLTFKNVYDEKIFEFVMNPTFIQLVYKKKIHFLTDELLHIHCFVKIHLPNYTGPFIDTNTYGCIIKKYCTKQDQRQFSNTSLRFETVSICEEILGSNIHIDCILPHFYSDDIIFGLDEHNNSVEIGPILSAMPIGSIKRVDNDNLRKIQWKTLVLIPCKREIRGHDEIGGFEYIKMQHLRTIGYTPILIYESKWNKMLTDFEKRNYLQQLIFQKNNSDYVKN